MNFALVAALVSSVIATPPACLLACVAEVSISDDSCANNMENILCITEKLSDKLNSCLESKCPNNNADAAKSAFSSVAAAEGATVSTAASSTSSTEASSTEASSTEASSAEASSTEASSTEASSSAAPSSAAPSSEAAPSEASSAVETSAAASSTAAPSTSAAPSTAPASSVSEAPSSISTGVQSGNGAIMVGSSVGLMGALAAAVLL